MIAAPGTLVNTPGMAYHNVMSAKAIATRTRVLQRIPRSESDPQ